MQPMSEAIFPIFSEDSEMMDLERIDHKFEKLLCMYYFIIIFVHFFPCYSLSPNYSINFNHNQNTIITHDPPNHLKLL